MKKIGCLTFHAAYNYGSALQAYALKKTVESISPDIKYSVINFRTAIQKKMYISPFEKKDLKSIYSCCFIIGKKKQLHDKAIAFERFFIEKLNLTKEASNEDDLRAVSSGFDVFVCGSDQVWNLRAIDFDWSYFLGFTTSNKKIAYACSMGSKAIAFSEEEKNRIHKLLSQFHSISVRDYNTYSTINNLGVNAKKCLDPTLLLNKTDWESLARESVIIPPSKPYILFYDLKRDKNNWKLAKRISKVLSMPVIITSVPFPRVIAHSLGMQKELGCGPIEFLRFVQDAAIVLTSSFHGCVFSVLFHKTFFVLNSQNDERIKDFFDGLNLCNRHISNNDILGLAALTQRIDYQIVDETLDSLRNESIKYLKDAIN